MTEYEWNQEESPVMHKGEFIINKDGTKHFHDMLDNMNEGAFDIPSYEEADRRLHRNIRQENFLLAVVICVLLFFVIGFGVWLFSESI